MRVRKTKFEGLAAIEISTRKSRLVAITEGGPRVAWFGPAGGRNLLFWDVGQKLRRGTWKLRGGHRIWVTRPGADESEESYTPDNEKCEVDRSREIVTVRAPADARTKTAKSLSIEVLDESTFRIGSEILNESDMLWSGGVWTLTCTLPLQGTTYGIPLGDESDWDVFTIVIPRKWGGTHTARINDPQIRFTEKHLILEPQGVETKRMVQASRGIIGMTAPDAGVTFLKQTPYFPDSRYPLNTNIAFYLGEKNFMVEMEAMGPERTVKPGDKSQLDEIWQLRAPMTWD